MFYILNFADHSFKSVNFEFDVRKFIKKAHGKIAPDDIEIINAWGDDIRYSVDEFLEKFPAADAELDSVEEGKSDAEDGVGDAPKPESVSIFVLDGIVTDVFATSPDIQVEIVDFDCDYGDKSQLDGLWDEAEKTMYRINGLIEHCEE